MQVRMIVQIKVDFFYIALLRPIYEHVCKSSVCMSTMLACGGAKMELMSLYGGLGWKREQMWQKAAFPTPTDMQAR
jgi:hypothetical protein